MIEQDNNQGIVTLRMVHGKANAVDLEFLEALSETLAGQHDAKAVILTGGGSMFSAGVDLVRMLKGGNAYASEFVPMLDKVCRELFEFPAPLVTAVNGHAIAGGCIFALCGDYRLMSDGKGRIGAPELRVSVPFPVAPLEVLRFAVPQQHMQSHVYKGETLKAPQALSQGFVDEVTSAEELMTRAQAIAEDLASIPAKHFRFAKQMLRAPALELIRAGQEKYNPAIFAQWAEPETLDGIRAYMAKLGG